MQVRLQNKDTKRKKMDNDQHGFIHKSLGVSDAAFERLVHAVPKALIESISENTPNGIKSAAINSILSDGATGNMGVHSEYYSALVGLMVEQGYNAMVAQTKKRGIFNM